MRTLVGSDSHAREKTSLVLFDEAYIEQTNTKVR